MTTWRGNTFCITGPLWLESTDHRWIALTKGKECGALGFSLLLAWTSCWTSISWVAGNLWRHDISLILKCQIRLPGNVTLPHVWLAPTGLLIMTTADVRHTKSSATHCSDGIMHYRDVIMSAMGSQITSHTIVYSTVYSGADQRKHQSSA